MKKTCFAKLAIVCFTVVAAFAFIGTPAQAETGTIASTVTMGVPIIITGDSDMVFGVLTVPTVGTDFWTINARTGDLTKSGDGNGTDVFSDDNSRGLFTINGEDNAALTYSVARSSNFSIIGMSLLSVFFTPSGASLNSSGVLVVGVGGALRVFNTTGSGSSTAEITLTADY